MKIDRAKKTINAITPSYSTLDSLFEITATIRELNREKLVSGKDIAIYLSSKFDDLDIAKVSGLIHSGTVETSHWVNVSANGKFIIDATGDRFNREIYFAKYRHGLVPWVYRLHQENMYFSINHMPTNRPEDLEVIPTDIDIVKLTKGPFYRDLRCIYL